MNILVTDISFLLLVLSLLSHQNLSNADNNIDTTQSIRENQTLVSSGGSFELGFFSPGNSKNWYLGIWYKNITPKTVAWVANREIPLRNSTSGVFKIIEPGLLVILNETNSTIWSSNNLAPAKNPVARLLDSGNLVLRDENDEQRENNDYLSSWKTNEDPAPGDFTYHLDPAEYPQLVIKKGADIRFRTGPWNGVGFPGIPDMTEDTTSTFGLNTSKNGFTHSSGDSIDRSVISRYTLNPSGVGQRWTWVDQTRAWLLQVNIPADNCDTYGLCGAYGSCSIGNFPVCGCLDKFVPKDPQGWDRADWLNGCIRRIVLNCTAGDGFLKYSTIKLPDERTSWYNETMTLEECKEECLKNCSCTAYTNLDIGQEGSGCRLWFGDLVDIRILSLAGKSRFMQGQSFPFQLISLILILQEAILFIR